KVNVNLQPASPVHGDSDFTDQPAVSRHGLASRGVKLPVKRKQWVLLLVLILAALALSGCGVSREGADVANTAPEGLWQSLVVWPLAKSLIWLDALLAGWNIPYHWGFAIITFTLLIKIVTFPLTLTQVRSMQAQKDLQPKIQELQKKYGKDREKLSKAQMELYQEAGVNPLSGCLPLVVQMPILFGLYSALVALGPSLQDASFFWIPDLGYPRYTQGMSWIPELFNAGQYGLLISYLILPILLVVSQFIMQKWMTPAPAGGDQGGMTRQISLMMTFMFGFFTLQVPAGLTLYWVTSNFLQMIQQWAVTSDRFSRKPSPALATASSGTSSNGASVVDGTVIDSKKSETASGNGAQSGAQNGSSERSTASNQGAKRRKSKKRR
ncbi:MAG: membrane protein insertase YidC, partial [Caldilineaceae bacterium]|nr:membrane protein insertase YidC [Caldilineaceae bacterium]